MLYSEIYTCESKREHPTQYLTAWTRNALFCDEEDVVGEGWGYV